MFYKLLDDNTISYGQYVQNPDFILDYTMIDSYSQPLPDGWLWFDTVQEAESYFNREIN